MFTSDQQSAIATDCPKNVLVRHMIGMINLEVSLLHRSLVTATRML